MKRIFKRWSVFAKNHGVYIEWERNTCITQFLYAIHRVESACHTDLIYIFAKRPDIGNDINMPPPGLLRHRHRSFFIYFSFRHSGFKFCDFGLKFRLGSSLCHLNLSACLFKCFLIGFFLFLCLNQRSLDFPLSLLFFAHLLSDGSLFFFLFVFFALIFVSNRSYAYHHAGG